MSNHDQGTGEGRHSLDAEDVRPFFSRGDYRSVYDLIVELPFYRRAMDLHMQWIRWIKTSGPIIIDVGGGAALGPPRRGACAMMPTYIFSTSTRLWQSKRGNTACRMALMVGGRRHRPRRVHEGLGGDPAAMPHSPTTGSNSIPGPTEAFTV